MGARGGKGVARRGRKLDHQRFGAFVEGVVARRNGQIDAAAPRRNHHSGGQGSGEVVVDGQASSGAQADRHRERIGRAACATDTHAGGATELTGLADNGLDRELGQGGRLSAGDRQIVDR